MKHSTILVAIGSAAVGAVLALAATDGLARQDKAATPSRYTNGAYGFSIQPPGVPRAAKDSVLQAAMFFAPAREGFAANLNVMVQEVKMSLDQYCTLSKGQFKQAGFKVLSEARKKVSGRDAVLWEYEGELQGRGMKWCSLAVADTDRVYLVTGTSSVDDDALSKEFKASLESFKLGE
jgi:hypothetical protein